MHSYGNETGQLAQGMPGRNTGTNTIIFIKKNQVPKYRANEVTYGLITCLVRPQKIDKPNRTMLVARGNKVHYPGDAGTPTANLLTVKLLLNSIISTPNAKFMTMDIKDFYLNTPMARFEYMQLRLSDMHKDVIAHYKLNKIATPEGYIYCEIQKGMYGLPQAGIIAQQLLKEHLQMNSYRQSKTTPDLWQHDTCLISFSLVVDDFRVKYVGKENAQYLLDTVRKHYKCSCDWKGKRYCGLTIKWDYEGRKVHLSMPEYIQKALTHFQHPPLAKQQNQSYPHVKLNYRAKKQYSQEDDDSPILNKAGKNHSGGMWSVPFPCEGGRWGTTPCHQLSCVPTGKPDRENIGTLQAIFRFHVKTGRRCTHLPSERHGPCNPQQCIVPLQAQFPQPHRRPHVHGEKRQNPHHQRGSPQHLTNNPGRHVIRGGGRTGHLIH